MIKLDIMPLTSNEDMSRIVKTFSKDKIVIGRGKSVDLQLEHDDVSSKHAVIYLNDDNTLSIEDLGSLNGTYVGDKKISVHEKFPIRKKDRIMIGDFLVRADVIEDSIEVKKEDNKATEQKSVEQTAVPVQEDFNQEEYTNLEHQEEQNLNKTQDKNNYNETDVSNEMIQDYELENILINENILSEEDELTKLDEENIFELDDDITEINDNDNLKNESSFEQMQNDTDLEINDNTNNKEEDILSSQEKLIQEERKEIKLSSDNETINSNNNTIVSQSSKDDSVLIISGTANNDIFDINLEAIKLLTLEGQCKRFGVAIPDVIITFNDKKAITDQNGYFKFIDIEENTPISLQAQKSGYVFEYKHTNSTLIDNTNIVFQGIKTCNISGKILYQGKGLDGVIIGNNLDKNIMTSKDGTFNIQDIKEGTNYFIKPQKENFIFDFDTSEKTLKEDATFIINATKLISISGYIKYKGVPIQDVIIDAGELGKTLTDKNGYYEFKNIKEGTQYSIRAYKEGFKFQKA